MINFPYFAKITKSYIGLAVVFVFVLSFFLIILTVTFEPNTDVLILQGGSTLNMFLANSFYALMAIMFPMVYSIVVGNGLIAKRVDDNSMAAFLSTPVSRIKIAGSSAVFFVLSHILMWGCVFVIGTVLGINFQADYFDTEQFLLLNIGALLFHLAISSICFFASCIFSSSKNSLLFGAGIPIFFFITSLLVKFSDSLEFFRYLSLNTLFDTSAIISGEGYLWQFFALGIIAVVLYSTGIIVFSKKNLSL